MREEARTTLVRSAKSLAEVAVWYSIAVIASLFVMLFLFATLSEFRVLTPATWYWFPIGAAIWLTFLIGSTWRLAQSSLVQRATITLAPVYALQAFLILCTLARLPFEKSSNLDIAGGMLLVWESWTVIFSLAFLFLAVCGRRSVPLRTWLTTAVSATVVIHSISQRI